VASPTQSTAKQNQDARHHPKNFVLNQPRRIAATRRAQKSVVFAVGVKKHDESKPFPKFYFVADKKRNFLILQEKGKKMQAKRVMR
jgi:hypothetical protein